MKNSSCCCVLVVDFDNTFVKLEIFEDLADHIVNNFYDVIGWIKSK